MDEPSPRDAFSFHTDSFEESRRRDILDIAGRPHAVDHRLRQSPLDYRCHCFTHQTLATPPPGKHIAEIDGACAYANLDQTREPPILFMPEAPRKCRPLDPDALASTQEFDCLLDTAMRIPSHVLGDRRIACVIIKDHLRIRHHSWLGREVSQDAPALSYFEWCPANAKAEKRRLASFPGGAVRLSRAAG